MPSISATGIGSGLDINDLVSQLVAAEREPTEQRLDLREVQSQAKLSAFGVLKGALAEFQDSLVALKDLSSFQSRKAASSDEELFTATASSDAALGGYSVGVLRLADNHKLVSQGFENDVATVGTGTLTVGVGENSFEVTIGEGKDTLEGIKEAIKTAADNTGITASIIHVDGESGESVAKLMLTANETGKANAITVTAVDDDGEHTDKAGLSRLVFDPDGSEVMNLEQVQEGPIDDLDAQVKIDGQTVTSSSNTVSGVIAGVDINLVAAAAEEGSPQQLSVALDTDGMKEAIDNFVVSFNALVDTFNELASYDAATGETGALFADATVRGLSTQLRRELTDSVKSLVSSHNSLTTIGITTDRNGKLTVDEEQLSASLATNFSELGKLLAGENGIAVRLDALVSGYVDPSGAVDGRVEGLNSRITDIGAQRQRLDKRLEKLEERLLAQFTAMDALVSQLNSTGDFLTQQFSALEAMVGQRGR